MNVVIYIKCYNRLSVTQLLEYPVNEGLYLMISLPLAHIGKDLRDVHLDDLLPCPGLITIRLLVDEVEDQVKDSNLNRASRCRRFQKVQGLHEVPVLHDQLFLLPIPAGYGGQHIEGVNGNLLIGCAQVLL